MKDSNLLKHLTIFVIAVSILAADGAALAQSDGRESQRPIYLDIRSVGGAQHSSLSDDLIAAMAREKLSALGRTARRTSGQNLPLDAYVLRILYVVHRQPHSDGYALAASASVELLRTDDKDHDGVAQTYSLYSGLQQILVQGADEQTAVAQLRDAFKRQLKARISVSLLSVSLS